MTRLRTFLRWSVTPSTDSINRICSTVVLVVLALGAAFALVEIAR